MSKTKNVLALLLPQKSFLVTPILMYLNIGIFILMVASGVNAMEPTSESLLAWGANFRPSTLGGELWRLFTSCFLHIGFFHLAMNMYALWYIGILLEPLLGSFKFALAYLLTGIFSSVASLWWNDLVVSAGASGAIFGMYGVFLSMLTTNLIPKAERKQLLTSIGIFIVYNLIYGLKGGVDNAAHIGGLVSGCILGYTFYPGLRWKENKTADKILIPIGATLLSILALLLFFNTSNDIGKYYKKMEKITELETKALEFYNLPTNTAKEKMLVECKDHGIIYWDECLTILDEVKELNLPSDLKDRNVLLIEYCTYRKQTYEFLYKSISNDTDQYSHAIDSLNQKVDLVVKKLQ